MRPTRALLSRNWTNKNPQRPQAAKIHPRGRQRRCLVKKQPEGCRAHQALSAWLPGKASGLLQSPCREGFRASEDTCQRYPAASWSSSLAAGRLGRLPRGPVPTRPLPSLGPGAGSSQHRG
ncbi:hypothetical protein R6Z07F_000054 [Ovis aries]